jgi:sulfur carrier protein
MIVQVNGERIELRAGATVATVMERLGAEQQRRGVAVAVGAEVVPRGEWERRALADGEQVEIVTAIQGG